MKSRAGFEPEDALRARVAADAGDLEAKYQLSVRCIVAGAMEEGLDLAMDILRADRTFRDDIGRLTMIRAFAVLGKGDEMAGRYRRRMFNFMH